jgi:hypothetical protein
MVYTYSSWDARVDAYDGNDQSTVIGPRDDGAPTDLQ